MAILVFLGLSVTAEDDITVELDGVENSAFEIPVAGFDFEMNELLLSSRSTSHSTDWPSFIHIISAFQNMV